MDVTAYNLDQIIQNERGWLFYDAALKGWKEIYTNLLGVSVLDVGCASGISMGLIKLFNPKIKVVGLEGNDSGKNIWETRRLDVVSGNIFELPFPDDHFDTVYSSHVLEHLTDPKKAIAETARVAKKRIIHVVPEGNIDDKNHGSKHLHYYNRINFEQEFDGLGLRKVAYKAITDNHINSLIAVYDV